MIVQFTRTGGIAGITLMVTLDSRQLPQAEADRLCRLVASAAFFEQPESLKSAAPGADRFQYRVTVEEGDRKKRVETDESSCPGTFRPLLDYLVHSARARQKTKRS